jgi:hypothetical protein
LDCGGNPESFRGTPLSQAQNATLRRKLFIRPKAPSPLRSAGAVQDRAATADDKLFRLVF